MIVKVLTMVLALLSIRVAAVVCAGTDPAVPEQSMGSEMALFSEVPSVFGASKYDQKLSEAPSYVTIVTAEEIKRYGWRNFAEILRSVPGFFTFYDRNYHYLGVRGFGRPGDYNTRVLILVDGHRLNDDIADTGPVGTDFPLDVDLIERVEVIRGPSSSLYGNNAFFGVINVVTRTGRDLKGFEVSGEGGSYNTYKGRASYGQRFQNGFEVVASGSYYSSRGQNLFYKEFDHPLTSNGWARHRDDDEFYNFFLRSSYKDFSLEGVYQMREKGIPTGSWDTVFDDSRNRTFDERAFLDLKYDHRFTNDLNLTARLYVDHYNYNGHYLNDYGEPGLFRDLVLSKDYQRGDWAGGELQIEKRIFDKHRLVVGTELVRHFRQDQVAYDVDPFQEYLNVDKDSWNWAAYLQDEYRMCSNLALNAGVRYDYFSTFGDTLNPRLALIFTPSPRTTLKAMYGSAFRAPNAYELYYGDNISQKTNDALQPETIRTCELVWEQQLSKNLRSAVSAYYYTIDDLITLTTDPADGLLVFVNEDEVQAKGIEFELFGKWGNGIEARASYALQETMERRGHRVLTNSPVHNAKFNLVVPLFRDKLYLGSELLYLSPRKTLLRESTDDAFIANMTLFSRNLVKGLEVSASVYNLFNQKYSDPGSEEHLRTCSSRTGPPFV